MHIIVHPMKLDQSSSAREKGELGREETAQLSAGLVLKRLFLWNSSQGRGGRGHILEIPGQTAGTSQRKLGQDSLPTHHKRK